jgi:hypothetical protein
MMEVLTKFSARDYVKIAFELDLPVPLHAELIAAARDARIHPELFAAECVESILASRKLPSVKAGRCGPRVGIMEAEEL